MTLEHNLKWSPEAAQVAKDGEWGCGAGSLGHTILSLHADGATNLGLIKIFTNHLLFSYPREKGVSE